MGTFIEIILLLFIAGFLVLQTKGGLREVLGRRRKIILDSCALIDGRVVEIMRSHFVADDLVIPQFVLNELQLLADGNDSHKRERARFGLDIAHELQDTAFESKVTIDRSVFPDIHTTDDKLIALAKKLQAYLYTTDYNLAKVAAIEAVGVLNVNGLAQALRPVALPGETLKIKILQKGSNPSQGVGYLEDGTMIVVEGGARYTGRTVDVTVTRMHQTVAGKMVFGQAKEDPRDHQQSAQQRTQQQAKIARAEAESSSHPQTFQQQTAQHEQEPQRQPEQPAKPRLHDRLNRSRQQPASQQQAQPQMQKGLQSSATSAAPRQTGQQSSSSRRRRRPLSV